MRSAPKSTDAYKKAKSTGEPMEVVDESRYKGALSDEMLPLARSLRAAASITFVLHQQPHGFLEFTIGLQQRITASSIFKAHVQKVRKKLLVLEHHRLVSICGCLSHFWLLSL